MLRVRFQIIYILHWNATPLSERSSTDNWCLETSEEDLLIEKFYLQREAWASDDCVTANKANRCEKFHENDIMELHSKWQNIFQLNGINPTIPTPHLNVVIDLDT